MSIANITVKNSNEIKVLLQVLNKLNFVWHDGEAISHTLMPFGENTCYKIDIDRHHVSTIHSKSADADLIIPTEVFLKHPERICKLLHEGMSVPHILNGYNLLTSDLSTGRLSGLADRANIPNIPKTVYAKDSLLREFTSDMLLEASQGKYTKAICREDEVNSIIRILCRKKKNNPLLVGDPGVGKTAIIEHIALLASSRNTTIPESLHHMELRRLDPTDLIRGTKYRGDLEKRVHGIIDEASRRGNVILFIDEIHSLIKLGGSDGGMSVNDILKPALTNSGVRIIGCTTTKDFHKMSDSDGAFMRRFQEVTIIEPSKEITMQIIRGSIHNYQKHYNIVFNDELLCLIVDKSDKYMKGSKLPDKAFAIIDDVGSACVLARCAPTEEIVDDVISVMARIPKAMLSNEDRTVLRDLPANLKKRVYGQDEACDIICKSIAKSRLGIREPNKPVSSMILAGRTGTGKTLTVQELGDILGLPLVKFDMSEYQQKETVSKLIGSSKGYSGYDEGGLLTTAIKKNPHCILLLDEIEKAHKDVYNTFLQVMDTAELTDNKGIKVDFRNVLLVMTSNLGVSELNKGSLGFCDSCVKDNQAVVIKAIKAEFSPEFFNRFDNVIVFNDLSPSNIQDITIHELKKIEARVAKIGVIIDFSPHAIEWLSTHGTNKEYGARILKRLLESSILDPLTDILLSEETGDILVDVAENKIILVSTEAAQAAG